jgi:hypothetical protein
MAIGTTGGAPQYCFKDGKLLIFSGGEVMVIRGWPVPTAVRKVDGRWVSFWPEYRLVSPYRPARKKVSDESAAHQDAPGQLMFSFSAGEAKAKPAVKLTQRSLDAIRRKRALNGFRFSLPKEVARAIEPFRSHQWPMLVLLAHDPTSLDLAESNPALAYAIALHLNGDLQRINATKPGTMKQRDLLAMLGVPPSKSLVNLFHKITPESIDGQNLFSLLPALSSPADEAQKLLAHAPKINLGVMQLALDARVRQAVTPALVAEVAADPKEKYRASVAQLLADTLAMDQELGSLITNPKFSAIERLREVHEETAESFQLLRRLKESMGPLPLPPLPGIEDAICPLRTQHELVAEGIAQHNCVANYAYRVTAGECFIYMVLQPERATLSIERGPDRQWHIGELKAACNMTVRPPTRAFVREWLDRYRFGIGR